MSDKFLEPGDEEITLAMTRPSQIGGFSLNALVFSLMVPSIIAMFTKQVVVFAAIPVFLLISYVICLKDIYLFEIMWAATSLRACQNKKHWGCRSYAPD